MESMTRVIPMAVLEMPEFGSQAAKFMTQEEILEVVTEIAKDPEAGDVVPGCGGIRKLRVKASGHGKRGGGRVIYVYYCEEIPVFLLACYPKNAKDDLTNAEKKELRRLVPALKIFYEKGLAARIRRAKVKGDDREEQKENNHEGRPRA